MADEKCLVEAYLDNFPSPDGYVLFQRAPMMEMLEHAWAAMDEEGTADFISPEDLAIAWFAMIEWAEKNYGAAP